MVSSIQEWFVVGDGGSVFALPKTDPPFWMVEPLNRCSLVIPMNHRQSSIPSGKHRTGWWFQTFYTLW